MLSARLWNLRRASWPALVFWLWLGSLAVSFAFNDEFHAPSCPEHVLLHWAGHSSQPEVQPAALHLSKPEIECAACAFAFAAMAVLVALAWHFGAPEAVVDFTSRVSCAGISRFAAPIARGPPLHFV